MGTAIAISLLLLAGAIFYLVVMKPRPKNVIVQTPKPPQPPRPAPDWVAMADTKKTPRSFYQGGSSKAPDYTKNIRTNPRSQPQPQSTRAVTDDDSLSVSSALWAAAVLESNPEKSESYSGQEGTFGGAGASGSWEPEPSRAPDPTPDPSPSSSSDTSSFSDTSSNNE